MTFKYWECTKCENLSRDPQNGLQELIPTCAGCARPKGANTPTRFKENPICERCEDKTKCQNPTHSCLCTSCVGRNHYYCSEGICPYVPEVD